jgi:iron complex outermembrane receptor protein
MNKRKSFSLFTPFTARLVHLIFQRAFCVLFVFVVLCAHAAETKTNKNSADLTSLSLEALMNIEVPTVSGASKFEQKVTEAPSSVTIITADEIKRYGYRTLADILQSVQGFYVSYDRNYSFLGSRGMNLGDSNSRILLLVNGHRINNNLTDGAAIGTDFILDVDLIDHVEIIRGPSAVLYGNNAFFGVINVITRQGKQLNGAEVSGEYGSYDTYKGRVTYGNLFTNGVQLLLSGTYYDSAGPDRLFYKEFNTPSQNNGVAQGIDGDSFGSFFGSLGYADFTLEGAFISREKENPTAQFGSTYKLYKFEIRAQFSGNCGRDRAGLLRPQ